jgi:hypothetical protein
MQEKNLVHLVASEFGSVNEPCFYHGAILIIYVHLCFYIYVQMDG